MTLIQLNYICHTELYQEFPQYSPLKEDQFEIGPFDFYMRMIVLSVILMSGLQCIGFLQASEFDTYKQMILLSVILCKRTTL